MSGRGRRGRWGKGGAKRSREEFEMKASSTPESTEAVAPLPGGFKSLKAKWISVYESERKAQESSQPACPASADIPDARKLPAAEPLGRNPAASMPQSTSELWRTERPAEAMGDNRKKQDNGNSVMQQKKRPEALEMQQAESKEPRPLSTDASEQGAPSMKRQRQRSAASKPVESPQAAATLPEPASSPVEAIGGISKAFPDCTFVEDRPKDTEPAWKAPSSFAAPPSPEQALNQTQGGRLAQNAGPVKAVPERSPGKVAAMQDAAASLKAASKAHSSIRAPLSPERAPAESGRPAAAERQPGSEAKQVVPTEVKTEADSASAGGSGHHTDLAPGQQEGHPRPDSIALMKAKEPKAELKEVAKEFSANEQKAKDTSRAKAGDLRKHDPKDNTGNATVSGNVPKQRKQKGQKGIPPSQKDPPIQPHAALATAAENPAGRQQGLSGQRAGQRAAQTADNDVASRSQVKKAIAQAKAAAAAEAEAADSHQQADSRAEEQSSALKAQRQDENQIAQQEVPALAQQAQDPGTAAGAEEASRQKGSDASSLERSPDIPQKQQPPGDEAPVGASGSKHVKQGDSLAGEHPHHTPGKLAHQPKPSSVAVPATGHSLQLAPVEYLGDGSGSSQQLGQIDLSQYDSYRALWAGLREDYGQALPEGLSLRLVYEDGEGDFVMLQPDEPWGTFLSSARRVIISCQ